MKKIYQVVVILMACFAFGCETTTTDHVSFVTSYPVFKMEGDALISIVGGGAFTDPGVSATEAGKDLTVTTSGAVDTGTPGVYVVTYSAKNSDGFTGSTTRTVVVTAKDVSATDLTGTYLRNNDPTRPKTVVTKLVSGYYHTPNGSGDANNIAVYFVHTGDNNLLIPIQSSPFGRVKGTGSITATGISWVLTLIDPPNAGISFTRNLVKQ